MNIRPLLPSDRPQLDAWIVGDADHKDRVTADYFYEPGTETLVFEDECGPVAYVRCSRALRIALQVDTTATRRNAQMFTAGMPLLVAQSQASGYQELIFDSTVGRLIRFCMRRLGFQPSRNEYRRLL